MSDSRPAMNQSTNSPVAVRVSRKGRTNPSDLESIRKQLFGNTLALKYIGSFLNYANSVLCAAERACRSPYDQARAEIAYGNSVFIFSRLPLNELEA